MIWNLFVDMKYMSRLPQLSKEIDLRFGLYLITSKNQLDSSCTIIWESGREASPYFDKFTTFSLNDFSDSYTTTTTVTTPFWADLTTAWQAQWATEEPDIGTTGWSFNEASSQNQVSNALTPTTTTKSLTTAWTMTTTTTTAESTGHKNSFSKAQMFCLSLITALILKL